MGKHIDHLFDDYSLTFGDLRSILRKSATGKLNVEEKLDGVQLWLTYSPDDTLARGARNQTQLQKGGLTADEMAAEFADNKNPHLAAVFSDTIRTFERVARQLPSHLFQPPPIFYHAEILSPEAANVVNYDVNLINIHRSGHINVNNEQNIEELANALKIAQNKTATEEYRVQVGAIQHLKAMHDDKPLIKALNQLNSILKTAKLSENDTIGDYLVHRLDKIVERELPGPLSEEEKEPIIKKILGVKGISIKNWHPEAKNVAKNANALKKLAVRPLEHIIHDFSVELLQNMNSAFVLDDQKEAARISKELKKAIDAIKDSKNEETNAILQNQLKKIKNFGKIQPLEGVVFKFGDHTYKYTGDFAAVNQILNLFRYGKGHKIAAIQAESDDIQAPKIHTDEDVIALFPGSFKPPTVAHYEIARKYALHPRVKQVIVIIGPGIRSSDDRTINIARTCATKIWKNYFAPAIEGESNTPILIQAQHPGSPIQVAYKYVQSGKAGDVFTLVAGKEEDQARAAEFVHNHRKNGTIIRKGSVQPNYYKPGVGVVTLDIGGAHPITYQGRQDDIENQPVRATTAREDLAQHDVTKFGTNLPKALKSQTETIYRELLDCSTSTIPAERDMSIQERRLKTYLEQWKELLGVGTPTSAPFTKKRPKRAAKSAPPGFGGSNITTTGAMEETATMAAGAVEGAPATPSQKHKRTKKYIDRKQFVDKLEEMQFREHIIRPLLKQIMSEEQELRKIVRNLVKQELREAKAPTPHANTGLNVLDDLLHSIIGKLRVYYYKITTVAEQRKSFRAHVLQGIENMLLPEIAMDVADINNQVDLDKPIVAPELKEDLQFTLGTEPDKNDLDVLLNKDAEGKRIPLDGVEPDKGKKDNIDFSIEGEDSTGQQMAMNALRDIRKEIVAAYNLLSLQQDRQLFYDGLLTNVKLWFDAFEDELQPYLSEPEVPESGQFNTPPETEA